jgi:hypothetical protein
MPMRQFDTKATRDALPFDALIGAIEAVVGCGRVASLLPYAYRSVRPVREMTAWSRNHDRALQLAARSTTWRRRSSSPPAHCGISTRCPKRFAPLEGD